MENKTWKMAMCGVGLTVLATFCFGGLVIAAVPKTEAGYKIGVVNLDAAVSHYDRRASESEVLRSRFDQREERLLGRMRALDEEKKAFESEAAPTGERFKIALRIDDYYYALQHEIRRFEADKDRELQRLELKLSRDIQSAIDALANEENYHLIFREKADHSDPIVFASTTINVTSRLIDRLNKAYANSPK